MHQFLQYLNAFQRVVLKQMLLHNAELVGWNSREGKQMVLAAAEVTRDVDPINEEALYRQPAYEIAVRTL